MVDIFNIVHSIYEILNTNDVIFNLIAQGATPGDVPLVRNVLDLSSKLLGVLVRLPESRQKVFFVEHFCLLSYEFTSYGECYFEISRILFHLGFFAPSF
jgi:hypothetical protein